MRKTIYRALALFLILLITVSAASAACNGPKCTSDRSSFADHFGFKNLGNRYGGWFGYCPSCDRGNGKSCGNGNCGNGRYCPDCNRGRNNGGCIDGSCNGSCPDGNCGDNVSSGTVDTETLERESGITTVRLCRNGVCQAGGNGRVLTLINYNNATNPTYDELIAFLKADKTDEHPYTRGYSCADFARTLHNNAEKAGIKAGWVGVRSCDHAFNVFNTTDRGLVYIDCTGLRGGGTLQDKELNCTVGQPLTGKYLFRDGVTMNMGCRVRSPMIFW